MAVSVCVCRAQLMGKRLTDFIDLLLYIEIYKKKKNNEHSNNVSPRNWMF